LIEVEDGKRNKDRKLKKRKKENKRIPDIKEVFKWVN
jgi:hypothetical protein